GPALVRRDTWQLFSAVFERGVLYAIPTRSTKAYHLQGGSTPLLDDHIILDRLPPTFTPADVAAAGIPRHTTYAWRDAGMIVELGRGVYRKADAPETAYLDLLAATKRAPRAIICLVSALAVHDLTDEIPPAVQLAVPRGAHPPQISYPMVEFSRFDPRT